MQRFAMRKLQEEFEDTKGPEFEDTKGPEFEDTKGSIIIRKSKDRQHNGQKKKDKQ